MAKMISIRIDRDEQRAIETITAYLEAQNPGTNPNRSDAVRYALNITGVSIEWEKTVGINKDKS